MSYDSYRKQLETLCQAAHVHLPQLCRNETRAVKQWHKKECRRAKEWREAMLRLLTAQELRINYEFNENLQYLWQYLDSFNMTNHMRWVSWW